jgi:hypothetical protein
VRIELGPHALDNHIVSAAVALKSGNDGWVIRTSVRQEHDELAADWVFVYLKERERERRGQRGYTQGRDFNATKVLPSHTMSGYAL